MLMPKLAISLFDSIVIVFQLILISTSEPKTTTDDEISPPNALIYVSDSDSNEDSNIMENHLKKDMLVDISSDLHNDYSDVFIATEEWQDIKPNQKVPSGLHYRMNLQTGKKEAKLLENNKQITKVDASEDEESSDTLGNQRFLIDQMKKALKGMEKNDEVRGDTVKQVQKSEFRTYDELKQEFKSMNMEMKTDLEILKQLLNEYRSKNCKLERKLEILLEFEYHVHQYDNAINFVNSNLNGLDIVKEALNDSNEEIRSTGALILGSAAQNNPKVKVIVYENGLLHIVLNLLANDRRTTVGHKLLYSLSALLINFPFAQKKMIELGGLDILNDILWKNSDLKQSIKILTLLTHLLEERREFDELIPGNQSKRNLEKMRQYEQSRLVEILRLRHQATLCSSAVDLLNAPVVSSQDNLDAQEKILNFLDVSTHYRLCTALDLEPCWKNLINLKERFMKMYYAEDRETDDGKFWLDLIDKIARIMKYYNNRLLHEEF